MTPPPAGPTLGGVKPQEIFRAQVDDPEHDPVAAELRRTLTLAKAEAVQQVADLDPAGLRLVIPGLHVQLVEQTVQLARRVGAAAALALVTVDEQRSGCSVSTFKREVRDLMTSSAVELKRGGADPLGRLMAEVLAQRLALRHSHEFLSWLAFRRDDPRHDAADRLARLEAFKVQPRLLKSRSVLRRLVGGPLALALESHDRFTLAHRWRPHFDDAMRLEGLHWRLLSYQGEGAIELEQARDTYDGVEDPGERKHLRMQIEMLLIEELADALVHVPLGLGTPQH